MSAAGAAAVRFGRLFDLRALGLGAAVLAPTVAAATLSGNPSWWRAVIIAISGLIACERAGLAPLGVVLHGAAICAGVAGLTAALAVPLLFVAAAALLAGCSVLLTLYGAKLRSLGTFTFIPVLYVSCEMAEGVAPHRLASLGLQIVPYAVAALVPVLLTSALRHHPMRKEGTRYLRHALRLMRWADRGEELHAANAACAAVLGVACAAMLVEWQHLPHGQWVIWSAASVVAAEVAAHRKMWDRAVGAIAGVPIGIGLASLLPPHPVLVDVATAVALLSLTGFRSYRIAFGTRCACASLALMISEHSGLVAAERAGDVLLGGLVGLIAFGVIQAIAAGRSALVLPPGVFGRSKS